MSFNIQRRAIPSYGDNPPAKHARKMIICNTVHLGGIGGNQGRVWKSFLRGLNPIFFMDPYDGSIVRVNRNKPVWERFKAFLKVLLSNPTRAIRSQTVESIRWIESIRGNMGYTLTYANKINLAAMVPRNDLASTKYCLANPGSEYLVYLPCGGQVTAHVSEALGTLSVEWFNPTTGETTDGGMTTGGGRRAFTVPFSGDAVLYIAAIKRRQGTDTVK